MRTALAGLLITALSNLIFAAPASRITSDDEDTLTLGIPLTKRQADWPTTLLRNDGGNGTGDQIATNTFKVPGTNTTLVFYLGTQTNRINERSVINATIAFINQQVAASGDGQLPQNVDPFTYDLEQGVFVTATSRKGQHLTWGLLGTTFGWLNLHLSGWADYKYTGIFHIWDEPWGLVGDGQIQTGFSGVTLPRVVAGPAGVTHY